MDRWKIGLGALLLLAGHAQDEDKVETAKRFVEEVRGLKFVQPLQVKKGNPGDFGRKLLREFKETFGQDLAAVERFLKVLRVVPDALDLQKAAQVFLLASFSAFYDAGAITLGENTDLNTLAHELTHALDDQHFGLAKLKTSAPVRFDALMALASLIEGDAEVVENLHRYGQSTKPDLQKLREYVENEWKDSVKRRPEFPAVFSLSLSFPYTWGEYFVEWHRQKNGQEGVNKLFAAPPRSTEQILHPDKYGTDEPTVIDASNLQAALQEFRMTYQTTLGELGTRALLWSMLKQDPAFAAQGWDGDWTALFEGEQGRFVVWLSVWDSEEHARQARAAFVEALRKVTGTDPMKDRSAEEYLYFEKEGRSGWVERKGSSLAVIVSAPAAGAQAIREAVWKCRKNAGNIEDF